MISVAFSPHLSTGLILSKSKDDFACTPSGRSLTKARDRIFEVGSLHNVLEKGLSEADRIGIVINDTE